METRFEHIKGQPTPGMFFEEALGCLRSKREVRRRGWKTEDRLVLVRETPILMKVEASGHAAIWFASSEDLLSVDWELTT